MGGAASSSSGCGMSLSRPAKQSANVCILVYPSIHMYLPLGALEASCMLLHCWAIFCEYTFSRLLISCGCRLCESMAATSITLLRKGSNVQIHRKPAHGMLVFVIDIYAALSCTMRTRAFWTSRLGSEFGYSFRKSSLSVRRIAGLLLTGSTSRCVRSLGSEPFARWNGEQARVVLFFAP